MIVPQASPSALSLSISGTLMITGATSSTIVIVCVTAAVFPAASVAVHVRVMVPLQSSPADNSSNTTVILSSTLSVAVSVAGAGTSLRHDNKISCGIDEKTGASVSVCSNSIVTSPLPLRIPDVLFWLVRILKDPPPPASRPPSPPV